MSAVGWGGGVWYCLEEPGTVRCGWGLPACLGVRSSLGLDPAQTEAEKPPPL